MPESDVAWLEREFNVKRDEIVAYNGGICYSRIIVNSKEAAERASESITGTVNGGMFHGMPLGNVGKPDKDGHYDIKC